MCFVHRAQSGTSLIEVLVALALSLLVLTGMLKLDVVRLNTKNQRLAQNRLYQAAFAGEERCQQTSFLQQSMMLHCTRDLGGGGNFPMNFIFEKQ